MPSTLPGAVPRCGAVRRRTRTAPVALGTGTVGAGPYGRRAPTASAASGTPTRSRWPRYRSPPASPTGRRRPDRRLREALRHGPDEGRPDGDGLTDAYETSISHTDPLSADTDHDGITDAAEVAAGQGPGARGHPRGRASRRFRRHGEPRHRRRRAQRRLRAEDRHRTRCCADTDHDGLPDGDEIARGLNPRLLDSNNDGLADGFAAEHDLLGGPAGPGGDRGPGPAVLDPHLAALSRYRRGHAQTRAGDEARHDPLAGADHPARRDPGLAARQRRRLHPPPPVQRRVRGVEQLRNRGVLGQPQPARDAVPGPPSSRSISSSSRSAMPTVPVRRSVSSRTSTNSCAAPITSSTRASMQLGVRAPAPPQHRAHRGQRRPRPQQPAALQELPHQHAPQLLQPAVGGQPFRQLGRRPRPCRHGSASPTAARRTGPAGPRGARARAGSA